jgi:hypothetical protein
MYERWEGMSREERGHEYARLRSSSADKERWAWVLLPIGLWIGIGCYTLISAIMNLGWIK